MKENFEYLPEISSSWVYFLDLSNLTTLDAKLTSLQLKGHMIYPERLNTFKAFETTSFENVKVVIIGQDPYHGAGEAHGLSFSVPIGVKIPPSLRNIFKELHDDLGVKIPESGDLTAWARQGVLLLNDVLTVEADKAGSHQKLGWQVFTDSIIKSLNKNRRNLVFILWGSHAQKKGKIIDRSKHLVIESVHPSPLSSYRGFFGSKPFSKANEYLKTHEKQPINWSL